MMGKTIVINEKHLSCLKDIPSCDEFMIGSEKSAPIGGAYSHVCDEVFSYSGGDLSGIAHYVGGILKGNSVLLYTDGDLSSVVFTEV